MKHRWGWKIESFQIVKLHYQYYTSHSRVINPFYILYEKRKDHFFEDWPAQSPDLNPIEHLWHHVKIRLGAYETPAKNVKELWERFDYEWNQFTIEDLEPYYNSMPDRVLACIKNKGGNIGH